MQFRISALARCGVYLLGWLMLASLWWQWNGNGAARAQEPPAASATETPAAVAVPVSTGQNKLSLWTLYWQGGMFMHLVLLLCFVAVTMTIERAIALRRSKVIPQELVTALGQMGEGRGGFDPRQAYKICQQFPSAAATVVKALLLKIGRPLPEVEHAISESKEREADRLYSNVRWLNLCASVAPLIGLIGTIQGMILAFHKMTNLHAGANKAVELADGIYTALVTTFGGLVVAIPAAIAAHHFEGHIQKLFHDVDDLASSLLPLVERYEGRARFGRGNLDGETTRETGGRVGDAAPVG